MIDKAISCISSSLQIAIDPDAAEEEILYRWDLARKINQHSRLFLEGKISGSDFLDLAETTEIDIDGYAEEIEENLEEIGFLL
jgi:hypothetical protein